MSDGNRTIVIEGEDNVRKARVLTLRSALELEIKGLKRRGRSVYSIIKEEFGFKGNKKRVLQQFEERLKETYNMEEE